MEQEISGRIKHAMLFARELATPVFIVDQDGNVLFYNKQAGDILGRQFDDTRPIHASTWTRIFMPTDESGSPLMPENLPLMIAVTESRPNYGTMWIEGVDNIRRHIGVAAFPITGNAGEIMGAMAVYWEVEPAE